MYIHKLKIIIYTYVNISTRKLFFIKAFNIFRISTIIYFNFASNS